MKKVIMIGIAGGSASGKSSISKRLKGYFDSDKSFQIIKMDDYYKDQPELTLEERHKTNYDHPLAFDEDLLLEQIKLLKQRVSIDKPVYDFVLYARTHTEKVTPADVIVLEGLFILDSEKIREQLDIKIFVDTPADVRFIRRLVRDVKKRGRTLDSVVNQYLETVRPMHELFVEPSKRYADIIIPEGGHNLVAIDLLTTKIRSILAANEAFDDHI